MSKTPPPSITLPAAILPALVGAVSFGLLMGALAFQYIDGYLPCTLCYWQRYTHVAVLLAAVIAVWSMSRWAIALGGLASLVAVGVAVFHSGVERKLWEGLKSCSGQAEPMGELDGAYLLDMSAPIKVIACSDITWDLYGLSMANWNAIVSLGTGLLWVWAWRVVIRHRNG